MDRKNLVKEIKDFKKKIGKKYKINELILFGSRARNKKVRSNSDVDLIVVGNFKGDKNIYRAPYLYKEWVIDLPVDFVCLTQKEFNNLKRKISIVSDALAHGIVIK